MGISQQSATVTPGEAATAQQYNNLVADVESLDTIKSDDDTVVHNTGNETIDGEKSYIVIPYLPPSDPTNDNHATRRLFVTTLTDGLASAISDLDAAVVHKTGNETVAGVKTLTSLPIIPTTTPTNAGHAISKDHLDGEISTINDSIAAITYPKVIYKSSPTTFTAGTVQTITHSLGLTQADVQKGKYSVIITGETASNNRGHCWTSHAEVGSGGNGVGSNVNGQEWVSGDPTATGTWYWQASTLKFKTETVVGNINNAVVQIIQNYE